METATAIYLNFIQLFFLLNFKVKYLQVSNNYLLLPRNVYLGHIFCEEVIFCQKELCQGNST
jgi:hypothetical protein